VLQIPFPRRIVLQSPRRTAAGGRGRIASWASSLFSAAVSLAVWGIGTTGQAQSLFWDANTSPSADGAQDGGGTWKTGSGPNWQPTATSPSTDNQLWPADPTGSSTVAIFGTGGALSSGSRTVTVDGTVTTAGLSFRAIQLSAGTDYAYQFSGGTIQIADGGSIEIGQGASNTATNYRIDVNSAIAGNNLTLRRSVGASDLGLIQFRAANTWTGTLSLEGSFFVDIQNLASVSTLSSINVGDTSTLVINFASASPLNVPLTLTGIGTSSRGAVRVDQSRTIGGPITLAGNAGISAGSAGVVATLSGNIGEAGGSRLLQINTNNTAGTVVLSGNNTFTGGVEIVAGTLRMGSTGALNASAPNIITFTNNVNAKTLALNGINTTAGGLSSPGDGGTSTVHNNSATAAQLILNVAVSANFPTYGGVIANGGAGGALTLVKDGQGTQALTGTASSYTGGTVLNAGVLRISGDRSLGDVPTSFSATNLTFNGGTLQLATSFNLDPNRGITLLAGGGTLDTAGNNSTYSGTITGAGVFIKTGTGNLTLDTANTHTGETRVTGGTLVVRHNQALGSTSGETNVLIGSRIELKDGVTITGELLYTPHLISSDGNNTWAGNIRGAVGSTVTLDTVSGNLLITGSVNAASVDGVNHTLVLDGASTGEITGVISNTVVVTKNGTSTWKLSGNNLLTGGLNLANGKVILAHQGALNAAAPNAVNFSNNSFNKTLAVQSPLVYAAGLSSNGGTGAIITENGSSQDAVLVLSGTGNHSYDGILRDGDGGGRLGLTRAGTGTQTLTGSSTYTGATTLASGTLALNFGATTAPATNILGTGTTLVTSGGTLAVLGRGISAASQTVNGLVVSGGASTISLTTHATTPQDLLLNLGAISRTAGSVNFVIPSGTQSATNGIRTSTGNTNGILGAWATVNGNDWATVNNGNIVAYTDYTQVTRFSTGSGSLGPLPDNPTANIKIVDGGTSGPITLEDIGSNGITEINTLLQGATGAATVDFGASPSGKMLRLGAAGGVLVASNAGSLTIGGTAGENSVLTAGGAANTAGELMFTNHSSTAVLTINSNVNNNGSGIVSLTKTGTGLLVLAGTGSTYSGGTVINGGTVRISGNGSLGATPASASATNITLNGGVLQWGAAFNLSSNRGITLQSGGGTLDTQGNATTYGGVISGTGGLTKMGAGTLTLTQANTYTGVTLVSAGNGATDPGVLVVVHNQALGTTDGGTAVASLGIVRLANGITVTGETITINGNGTGNNGNLQSAAGTSGSPASATWAGDVIIGTSGARVGTGNYSTLTISGAIRNGSTTSDLGIAASATGGVVVLSGSSTYTGSTSIVRGTVRLGRQDALPTGTLLNVHSSDLTTDMAAFDLAGFNQTISGLSSEQRSNTSNAASKTTVTNSSGTVATLTVNQASDRVYYGEITGALNLVKTGAGKLTLETQTQALTNSYTGKTTVAGGALALRGTGNIDGSTWVQIDAGAILSLTGRTSGNYEMINKMISGTGSVEGNLIVRGSSILRPGSTGAGGTLADAGAGFGELTFENVFIHPIAVTGAARLEMQLGGTTSNIGNPLALGNASYFASADSGGLYDTLQVNGTLGLNDTSIIRVTYGNGYTAGWGDVFNLLDWAILDLNGDGPDNAGPFTLASLDLSGMALSDGNFWATDKFISDGIIYVAPEPSRMLLVLTGAVALALRRRRRPTAA
jgi:autotransporter-associated beta strand protein